MAPPGWGADAKAPRTANAVPKWGRIGPPANSLGRHSRPRIKQLKTFGLQGTTSSAMPARARHNGVDGREYPAKADRSRNVHTRPMHPRPMRSRPMRSRPIGGKRQRYIDGRPAIGSRPRASELSLRQALARTTRPPEAFPRCPGSRHRPSYDLHRAHGARWAGTSLDHDPSARRRLGSSARRAVERPWGSDQGAENRLLAGRSRPSTKTTRTGPDRLPLLQKQQQRRDRIDRFDRHPSHLPPVSSPRLCHRDGKEQSRNIPTAWNFISELRARRDSARASMLWAY